MRVTVRNLGVLKEATIDLKPLTIFIGPNNSGKTWLAYALAGVLGPYGSEKYAQAYIEKQVPHLYELLEQAVEHVLAEGSATLDLSKFAKEYGEDFFNSVANYARNWMSKFLGTQLAHFDNIQFSLYLTESKQLFLKNVSLSAQRSSVAVGQKGVQITIRKDRNNNKISVYTSTGIQGIEESEIQISEKIPPEEIRGQLINFVSTILQRSLYPQINIFPTERTSVAASRFTRSMTDKELALTDLKVQEAWKEIFEGLTKLSNSGALTELTSHSREASQPVNSFTRMLTTFLEFGLEEREAREKSARSDGKIDQYIKLAKVLEKEILSGDIDFSTQEPDQRRDILFQPTASVHLELAIASSMTKELSLLVLYLRYLARPSELLIIDEPEMNLHPEAQAKIIEFLVMLVNAGLNVLFTTHSPYITDHLTNLIKANESEDKTAIKDKFFLQNTDAFISVDKVSVYGISEGKVSNVLDEDGFINLNTFGQVSERISDIYLAL